MTDKDFILDKDLKSLYSEPQEFAVDKGEFIEELEAEDEEESENDEK